ncbi:hypothetical protein M758_8G111500 [Ceratodon purpureus]|nr:hypothetical protein M758_8G111500 [Ceratodon purpureus]
MAERSESRGVQGRKTPPPFNKGAGGAGAGAKAEMRKKALKKPAELVAHYTAKGLDEKAAHEKVIEDLQKALAFSFQSYPMQKMMMMDKQLKNNMDLFTQRLSVIEKKVDSKPTLQAVFGAGVAAGGLLRVVWDGVPHLIQAAARITKDTKSSTSSSSI